VFSWKQLKSSDEYLYSKKSSNPFAIGLSIAVSYISAISVTSIPGEVYRHGNE